MKHFKKFISKIFTVDVLAWLFPVLLIVPNIALAITEQDAVLAKATDIILPLGVYYIIMSLSTAVGRTVLFCLPLMIFAAFQIVLLYLYGESIIAIDMYLNIVTTNPGEVAELLGNLLIAIATIVIIYVPVIIWSTISMFRQQRCGKKVLRRCRISGIVMSAVGLWLLVACYATSDRYSLRRNIFPVNVIANMVDAVNRTIDTSRYHNTSAEYSYESVATHPRDIREVYVLVIGETSRADNWQLFGYDRPTNPMLSKRDGIIKFPKTLTESNTTHKSVPMLLSPLDASTFGDSIYSTKGIFAAFNEAGFNTAFFSNQQRNRSFIDFFGAQAQVSDYIKDKNPLADDLDLVDILSNFITTSPGDKLFITLHTYGSHFNYHERYDKRFRRFVPDNASEASIQNRSQLVNAYDNTILYTDYLLDSIVTCLDSLGVPAALIYTSDHGEDIFDDERERFLHASPTPTFTQIHVPLLIWTSRAYNDAFPQIAANAESNSDKNVSSSRSLFSTILALAGIATPKYDTTADLCSKYFRETPRIYLNDYNEAVTLREAGFRRQDIKNSQTNNIDIGEK